MDRGAEQHGTLLPEVTHRAQHVGIEARQVGAHLLEQCTCLGGALLAHAPPMSEHLLRLGVGARVRVRVGFRVRVGLR